MKIVIFGSMTTSKEMKEVEQKLQALGHEVVLPAFTDHYSTLDTTNQMHIESAQNKIDHDLIKKYFEEIKGGDVCLTINVERKGIPGYIGGNTLIELGFAYVLDKPIYLMYDIPNMDYRDEIAATNPIIINGDLTKIC